MIFLHDDVYIVPQQCLGCHHLDCLRNGIAQTKLAQMADNDFGKVRSLWVGNDQLMASFFETYCYGWTRL